VVLVTAGVAADHLALGIFLFDLLVSHLNVGDTGNNIPEGNDIGILCLVVRTVRHKEAGRNTSDLFDIHIVFFIANLSGNSKVLMLFRILLTVGQLFLDLCHSRMSAVFKPGREQLDAILADFAVFQLFIAKHAYFFAADFAILLLKSVKKAHKSFLLFL